MATVVSIRFNPVTKIYFFDPHTMTDLKTDDRVIVETTRGIEMGVVVSPPYDVPSEKIKGKLKQVIRPATPVDLLSALDYKAQEADALEKGTALVEKMGLSMKILQAEYSFDGSRLTFAFVSEQRIDFRNLVKELNKSFKTRVEMKQIGARDETKIIDGFGRCGRRLCCSSWLTEFHSVSIKMAKNQRLPLAPSEISGLCGRLLCCLAFENETYVEARKTMPKVGSQIQLEQGVMATVRGLNVIKESVILQVEGGDPYLEMTLDAIAQIKKAPPPVPVDAPVPAKTQTKANEANDTEKKPARTGRRRRRSRNRK